MSRRTRPRSTPTNQEAQMADETPDPNDTPVQQDQKDPAADNPPQDNQPAPSPGAPPPAPGPVAGDTTEHDPALVVEDGVDIPTGENVWDQIQRNADARRAAAAEEAQARTDDSARDAAVDPATGESLNPAE